MSKSLGNVIDPLEIINEYGADALRFSIILITSQGQDVYLSRDRFEQGRNFANKIWNASRLVMMNTDPALLGQSIGDILKQPDTSIVNRWIVSRFYSTVKSVGESLEKFRFNEAAQLLYGFFWHEFCDWYLELVKNDFGNPATQVVMHTVLEGFLRALHPFMPFVTEEIWQRLWALREPAARAQSIMLCSWPGVRAEYIENALEEQVSFLFSLVTSVRNLRATLGIKHDQKVNVSLYPHSDSRRRLCEEHDALVKSLSGVEYIKLLSGPERPQGTLSAVLEEVDIYLHFGGLIDTAKEVKKISAEIERKKKFVAGKEARLKNRKFLDRAPEDVVAKEKESLVQMQNELKRLEQMLKEISKGQ